MKKKLYWYQYYSIVTVVQEDGKLIGVVARLDILRQKLNEGFVTIGKRSGIAKT